MTSDITAPHRADEPVAAPLRPKRVVASVVTERHRLLNAVLKSDCPVVLDTNVLLWGFGLNEQASDSWQRWLWSLRDRLIIPAWVVHEYNQLADKTEILSPYKTLSRKLQVALDELKDSTARAIGGNAVGGLGCSSKIELERKLTDASSFIVAVAKSVSRSDSGHRLELLKFYEQLLTTHALPSDVHELSQQAAAEFVARSAGRLSPGGEDADKPKNSCGDLIIWKELLQHCARTRSGEAIFISNDVKEDWCYKPARVVLENGREVPWSIEATRNLRLPNPELLAEFQRHTGGTDIIFATIQQVVEALSSTDHNVIEAAQYSHLAQAVQSTRNPTDRVVDWIHSSDALYREGLRGVAYWHRSPDEVNMEHFEEWCRDRLRDSEIPFEKVDWSNVFVALYL
ncbi:PIN-like domain-containing protein [Pseudomonas putida]|uniref:PIN-like domain-containing protein n=1 Tax=Pseudomonas putida TaxID=303 RepID=UPI00384BF09F